MKQLLIKLPDDFDLALYNHIRMLRYAGVKKTKAELVISLARIGLLKESAELLKEDRES